MKYTQFKQIPPLALIQALFTECTGMAFLAGVSWIEWKKPSDPFLYLDFEPYIRKCHQKILKDTVDEKQNPCAFLRQLLRPHGFTIELNSLSKQYTLCADPPDSAAQFSIHTEELTVKWC